MVDQSPPSDDAFGSLAKLLFPQNVVKQPVTGNLEVGSLAAILAALPVSRTVADRWFKDQTLKIDGYAFERCRFDRCKLVSEMATFTFKESVVSSDCQLYFTGASMKVV